MPKRRILYICHNHPHIRPGGAENYALELYEALKSTDDFEPVFLARSGPPVSHSACPHPGTLVAAVNDDPNQYFFYTDLGDFDWLTGVPRNKDVLTRYYQDFLAACRPDLVHFQHTSGLGYDLLRQTRNTLPDVPIVYTLHEFMPICHRSGQMLRTINQDELCTHASPRRCHECFPEISPQAFFMRKKLTHSHFALVDLFLSPSRFLLNRFAEWGIPSEKLRFEENARLLAGPLGGPEAERPRNRFAYFGQINPYKGLDVLLRAMQILGRDGPDGAGVHLWVHGANLDLSPGAFQEQIKALLETTRSNVTLAGRYEPADLPDLMARVDWVVVPSIWWENSPLVIQEAYLHRRPVICSNIGGMAEKVGDGVSGLHFRVRDPHDLARIMCQAVQTPGLWERLRRGIPAVHPMEKHVANLTRIYRELLHARPARVQEDDQKTTAA